MARLYLMEKQNIRVIARQAQQQTWIQIMEKNGFKIILDFESNVPDLKNKNGNSILFAEWLFGKGPVAKIHRIGLGVDLAYKEHIRKQREKHVCKN